MGTSREIRVGKLRAETFSLLISIISHLGLLGVSLSFFPPESTQYVKSIEVDYIISLPMGDYDLRESPGKTLVSSLTLASGTKNEASLNPFSILTVKPSISSSLRHQGRMISLKKASGTWQRQSQVVFSPPTKTRLPIRESSSLREGKSKMIRERVGVDLSIDETTLFSGFRVPDHYARWATLRDTRAWVYQRGHGKRGKTRVILPSRNPLFPLQRELGQSPMRRSEKGYLHCQIGTTDESRRSEIMKAGALGVFPYKKVASREPNFPSRISPGRAKESGGGEIISSPLDPMMQRASFGHPRTVREREFSPLAVEPSFHREETRFLKGETGLLTEGLELRGYIEKIRNLINANKKYPPVARQRGWEGKIKVKFTITSSGTVVKTEVSSPCSYEVLNRAAEKLIEERSPFPPVPFSWDDYPLVLEVLVAYELKVSTLTKKNES